MTAIVGILNKQGIAIAADSAVTTSYKIYNSANKIFTLSKYYPVGISIYGNATLGGLVPWDIIIKLYREKLGKTYFNNLHDYVDDFIDFIEGKEGFSTKEEKKEILNNTIREFFRANFTKQEDIINIGNILQEKIVFLQKRKDIESIKEISQDDFCIYISGALNDIKSCLNSQKNDLYESVESVLTKFLFLAFTKEDFSPDFSGIAIFGYGDSEIYPRLYEIKIHGFIDNKLKWYQMRECTIDNLETNAAIMPMAQSDVMRTIVEGISPDLKKIIFDITKGTIQQVVSDIRTKIKIDNIDFDPHITYFEEQIQKEINKRHIKPLVNTIATLPKEDLAEVAENFVYLTSLVRRITPYQESVGGPVDVAVISKGDGFIWIKRKHYFEERLNKNYFTKYFIQKGNDEK